MAANTITEGRLWLNGNSIHYELPGHSAWKLRLSDVLVFGEYTNNNGPFLDDYYFVFVTGLKTAYGASFYSQGRETFLDALGARLGMTFQCKLIGYAELASNVLWPKDIAGQPLYDLAEKIGAKALRWFGFGKTDVPYSQQVLAKLSQPPSGAY